MTTNGDVRILQPPGYSICLHPCSVGIKTFLWSQPIISWNGILLGVFRGSSDRVPPESVKPSNKRPLLPQTFYRLGRETVIVTNWVDCECWGIQHCKDLQAIQVGRNHCLTVVTINSLIALLLVMEHCVLAPSTSCTWLQRILKTEWIASFPCDQ